MRDVELSNMYSEILCHYRMMQSEAQREHERYIIMAASLDPEDEDELHELSFKAAKAYSDVLRYERAMVHIEDLRDREESE